jgi:hypothetical protein
MAQINVVEQSFGTWKKWFPILVHPMQYSLETQGNIVLALAVLHNMIIDNNGQSKFFDDPNARNAGFGAEEDPAPEPKLATQAREQVELQMWRDKIAQNMWEQYRHYLSRTR